MNSTVEAIYCELEHAPFDRTLSAMEEAWVARLSKLPSERGNRAPSQLRIDSTVLQSRRSI